MFLKIDLKINIFILLIKIKNKIQKIKLMAISKKTISVIGGSGYVGINVLKEAIKLDWKVNSISRSGKPKNEIDNSLNNVNWVKGDALSPDQYTEILKESDAIIHTVGTLLDSTLFNKAKPGDLGSYEHLNLETAKSIGKKINEINNDSKKRKMIYLSASKAPFFLERYITTKREAEKFLFGLNNINCSILRPGYIINIEQRKALLPLKIAIDLQKATIGNVINLLPKNFVTDCIRKTQLDDYVEMKYLSKAILACAFGEEFNQKILENEEIINIGKNYVFSN